MNVAQDLGALWLRGEEDEDESDSPRNPESNSISTLTPVSGTRKKTPPVPTRTWKWPKIDPVIFGVGLLAWASFLLVSYLLTIHFNPTRHQGHEVQQLSEQKAKAEAERQELLEENQQLRARLKQAEEAVAQSEATGRLPGEQPAETATSSAKSPP